MKHYGFNPVASFVTPLVASMVPIAASSLHPIQKRILCSTILMWHFFLFNKWLKSYRDINLTALYC